MQFLLAQRKELHVVDYAATDREALVLEGCIIFSQSEGIDWLSTGDDQFEIMPMIVLQIVE